MKCQHEWFIHVPWGKLALKSYGHPDGDPVFLVHGRQDSLSVFDPLIDQMSENFYYVALDMPGNGLSDAFPHGPKLQRFHFLYAMELAILHLGWDKFIFMGHSMGCEQGLFYNVIYPGRITKMVLLDAGPTLMRMQVEDNEEYQKTFFDDYYANYMRECFSRKKYTINQARQAIMKVRELTEDQCSHLLSRNFKELGIKYGSQEQPNGHSFEEEGPNNGPKSKTGEVADGAQNETEIKKKANKEDYEAQNAFEAEKENEADSLNRAVHENHQRQKSNRSPNTSFVERRKVKAAQKPNEARNAIKAPKTMEDRNAIRERNAIRARNAYRARMANDARNADEARNTDNALNADDVKIPPGAEEYIRFIDEMRKNDAVGYLSWDSRLKNLAPQNYGNDYYFELFKKIPPTLLVAASNGAKNVPPIPKWHQGAKELLDKMATLDNFHRVDVEGSHDVHYTHPERVLPYINAFLKDNKPSSKL